MMPIILSDSPVTADGTYLFFIISLDISDAILDEFTLTILSHIIWVTNVFSDSAL